MAVKALKKLGRDLKWIRQDVLEFMGGAPVAERVFRSIPFLDPPEARGARRRERLARIEEFAGEEARALGHQSVGAPHRWLGFVRLEIEEATEDLEGLRGSVEDGRRRVAEQWRDGWEEPGDS